MQTGQCLKGTLTLRVQNSGKTTFHKGILQEQHIVRVCFLGIALWVWTSYFRFFPDFPSEVIERKETYLHNLLNWAVNLKNTRHSYPKGNCYGKILLSEFYVHDNILRNLFILTFERLLSNWIYFAITQYTCSSITQTK